MSSSDLPYTKLEPVATYFDEIEEIAGSQKPELALEIAQTQQDTPPQRTFSSRRAKAIFFINLFALMQFLFLLMSKQTMKWYSVDNFDFLVVRTIVCLSVHTLTLLYFGNSIKESPEMNRWIIFRNLGGVVASGSQAFAISLLPITLYQVIYNTTPFWASLLSFVLLKERIKPIEGFAMILCFFLVILMSQTKQTSNSNSGNNIILGSILAMSTAFGASIKAVTTRRMQDVHFSVLMFHYTLF